MVWCNHCDDDCPTIRDPDKGYICCVNCGKVLDQNLFSDDPTFEKTAGGASRATSMRMESVQSGYSQSRMRTLEKGKDEIYNITTHLQMGGGDSLVNEAYTFYAMAIDKNFTRGRRTAHVAAACLYLVCRKMKKPYLLIDFSDCLQTNVYVLGAVFLQLCKVLFLEDHPLIQNLVDPSLFIHRFTERLLDKKNNGASRFQRKNNAVSETALRIVASMKRDWMQTGRKPSGLCGAALYISALSHGLNYSKSDIVTIVHICEATLTKRLIEFENTESGCLTIEEFIARADELDDEESNSNQLPVPGQVLCKHKGTEEPHFAHGLCRLCYDEFKKISGGLQGGAEPPAFQRAERQRMEKAAEEEKTKKLDHGIEPCDTEYDSAHDMREAGISAKDTPDTFGPESSTSEGPKVTGEGTGSPGLQADDISACDGSQDLNDTAVDDEEETFSDIDDDEVVGYLHNEEEKRYKTVIWESMNKEYLEEQAAKEAAAAKEGTDASSKPRKERKRRRSEDANNPAQTAAEATYKALNRKGHSSKINYEALDSLFDPEKEKRPKTGSDVEDYDADGMKTDIEDDGNALKSRRAEDGDEAIQYEDGDYAVDDYGEYYGNEDGDYANDEGYDFEY